MKRIVQYIVLLLLTALLVWGILWARGKANEELCVGVDVEVVNADSTSFVTPEGIKNDLNKLGIRIVGKPMASINASEIENKLRQSEYLESAECVKGGNHRVLIRVRQLVPVLRVFDQDNVSYYMNRDGKRMNAVPNYRADVPVVQGHFDARFPAIRLLPLVEYVESDSLLSSLVAMYSVRDSNNVFIMPNVYGTVNHVMRGHVVNLGSVDNYKAKLKKLCAFYKNVLPVKGWAYYDTISVKWDYQVVATRRNKKVHVAVQIDSIDNESEADLETIRLSDKIQTLNKSEGSDKKNENKKKK